MGLGSSRAGPQVTHPGPPVLGDEHGDPAATGKSANWVIRLVARMARLCPPEGPIRIGGDPSLAPNVRPKGGQRLEGSDPLDDLWVEQASIGTGIGARLSLQLDGAWRPRSQ